MIYLLLILSILVWPFGQLLNFYPPGFPLTLYPLDLLCLVLTFFLWLSPHSRRQSLRDPLFKPLAIFLLIATLSLAVNLSRAVTVGLYPSLFYLLRLFIYPSVYFSAKLFPGKKITPYLWLSLIFFSSLGLLQYLFLPDLRFLKYLGFDDHYYRLIGSFFDPNFSGAILAGVSLVLVSLSQWLLALLPILLLALTFSRASYLVFFLGLIYLIAVRKQWSLLVFIFLLMGLIAIAPKPFGEGVNLFRTFSIYSRLESWQTGLNLLLQKPLLGWGYNTLRSATGARFQIDNSYLYLAATTGLLGLLAFLNLLRQLLAFVRPVPQKLFLLALLAHSLFNNTLLYIWIYFAFWLVLATAVKGYKEP